MGKCTTSYFTTPTNKLVKLDLINSPRPTKPSLDSSSIMEISNSKIERIEIISVKMYDGVEDADKNNVTKKSGFRDASSQGNYHSSRMIMTLQSSRTEQQHRSISRNSKAREPTLKVKKRTDRHDGGL